MCVYVCVCAHMRLAAQLCPTHCNFVNHRLTCQAPLSMGILQARILECVAMPSSNRSSQHGDCTQVSSIAGRFFTLLATREANFITT